MAWVGFSSGFMLPSGMRLQRKRHPSGCMKVITSNRYRALVNRREGIMQWRLILSHANAIQGIIGVVNSQRPYLVSYGK